MSYDLDAERYPSFGTALRRHIVAALTALVACTLAGVYWGYSQPVQYVAQAQLIAGAAGVSVAATPAQAAASQTLAGTYSRVFAGDAVQEALRTAVPDPARVAASPIPSSGIIVIEAQSEDPDLAVATADAGVDALEGVVNGLLTNEGELAAATAGLAAANVRLADAERALAAAQAVQDSLPSPEANPDVSAAVAAASAAAMTAKAEVDALRQQYTDVVRQGEPGNGVRRLASAELTDDTSVRRVQLGYAVGIVGGLVLGGAVAYLLEVIATRRRAGRRHGVNLA